jgi:hypothetical protein
MNEAELSELLDVNNRTLHDMLTHADRDIAKAILSCKKHLGPLGMIEIALMMGKLLNSEAATESTEPGPFDPDSPQSRIVNDALAELLTEANAKMEEIDRLTLDERMKKVDERAAIKSVPPFGPLK